MAALPPLCSMRLVAVVPGALLISTLSESDL